MPRALLVIAQVNPGRVGGGRRLELPRSRREADARAAVVRAVPATRATAVRPLTAR